MPKRRFDKVKGVPADQLDKVMTSQKVQDAVQAKAEKAQAYWQSIAPVFDPDNQAKEHRKAPPYGVPGAYRDSIIIKERPEGLTPGKRVVDTDFKARWIEFGSAHMPTYAPAAKTGARFR